MSGKNTQYKKLKGSSLVVSTDTLYAGSDHLLLVRNNFFSEEYMRFYYSDIEAVITRKTPRGKIINICLLILLILFSFPHFLLPGTAPTHVFIPPVIVLISLFINLFKGTTSVSHIQTPVQTTKLSSLKRLRSYHKALLQIKPLIADAQGVYDKLNIKQHDDNAVPASNSGEGQQAHDQINDTELNNE